ncbi:hypothetical protein AVEN_238787-1 [Araneus ventricosus]|uniref:Uncharacterized protein n=1 Tax=Araneus ventricosus TaxID=182803 RepID=A0A4Y2J011_ARAVE|nr:hypothetical protein AVEN_238787-1 [Araneus ventricosus]
MKYGRHDRSDTEVGVLIANTCQTVVPCPSNWYGLPQPADNLPTPDLPDMPDNPIGGGLADAIICLGNIAKNIATGFKFNLSSFL